MRVPLVGLLQGPGPIARVRVLAGPVGEVGPVRLAVDVGGVRRVADHHRRAAIRVDEYALMADRVPQGREHAHALRDLGVAVEQLAPRSGEVNPLRGDALLLTSALPLTNVHVERTL